MERFLGCAIGALFCSMAVGGCGPGRRSGGGDLDAGPESDSNSDTDSTSPDSDAGSGLTIEEYCAREADIVNRWCAYADRCCSAADRAAIEFSLPQCWFGPDDPLACVDWANRLVSAGRVVFDGAQAQSCVDAQVAWVPAPPAGCQGSGFFGLFSRARPGDLQLAECRRAFVGQVASGGVCDADVECAAGLSCQGNASPYTCRPIGSTGSLCSSSNDCVLGLQCIDFDTCGTYGVAGSPCMSSLDCGDDLHCTSADYCDYAIPLGASCSADPNGCDYGTGCSFATGRCVSLAADGQSCTYSYECLGRCDTVARRCVSICGGTHYGG